MLGYVRSSRSSSDCLTHLATFYSMHINILLPHWASSSQDDHFNLNLYINKTLLTAPNNIVLKHSLASTGKVAFINAVIINLLFEITY